MIRYVEYAYLLAAVAIVVFMALNFADLPTANKVLLSLGGMLCGFMYSFRRKQRTLMEELDRKRDAEEAVADDNPESEDGH